MNITTSIIEKIRIEGAPRLDPIDAIFEDLGPREGKVTISCYGQSWTAYWGGMGQCTVKDFFLSCSDDYIANKCSSIRSHIDDFSALCAKARAEVVRLRKERDLSKVDARELYDQFGELGGDISNVHQLPASAMRAVFGDEWWYSVPSKPNPDYEYLCRIIKAVQEALKTLNADRKAAA